MDLILGYKGDQGTAFMIQRVRRICNCLREEYPTVRAGIKDVLRALLPTREPVASVRH